MPVRTSPRFRTSPPLAVLAGLLLATLAAGLTTGCKRAALQVGAANPDDWPAHNGGDDESAYSRAAGIDRATVHRLGLAWSLDLPGEMALEATPLEIDGTLYLSGSLSAVYSITGRLKWRYDPQVWAHMPQHMRKGMAVSRGVAFADRKVLVGAMAGRLIALDTASGKRTISGAPQPSPGAADGGKPAPVAPSGTA